MGRQEQATGWRWTWQSVTTLCLAALLLATEMSPLLTQAQGADGAQVEDDLSPEEELAWRHAPVLYVKRQRYACDTSGEPYLPMPVDAVLDDPSVLLRLDTGGEIAALDLIVKTGPVMEDLAWLGYGYYLDFPGNPMRSGCYYERWSRGKLEDHAPTVYARIATEEGEEGLALQYWMFWPFNDFNNRHEGDWELLQLNFEANSAAEALGQDPVLVVYAQHGGGERASWEGGKLQREGSHPIVYPAAGSHALYFERYVYLGWGEGGSGFGCDDTTGPARRVPVDVRLMPGNPTMDGSFAWLLFKGRWGERQPWEYNGPRGPVAGRRWYRPITWVEEVRGRSLYIPESLALGPTPGTVFCTITEQAARGLMFFTVHPWRMAAVLVGLFGGMAYLMASRRGHLMRASWLYLRYWGTFSTIGLVFIPLGFAMAALRRLVGATPPGEWLVEVLGRSDAGRLASTLLIGSLQSILEAVLIGPAVIAVIGLIRRGEPTDAEHGFAVVRERLGTLTKAWFRVQGLILLRVISIVGIPFALRDLVRWRFIAQAIMVEDARSARGASSTSAAAVSGTWWRTAAEVVIFSVIGLIPGPVIGIILMVTMSASIEFVHLLSSVVYAVAVPYKWIGLTLLYLDRTGRPLPMTIPNVPGAFWREVRARLSFPRGRNDHARTAS